jgi:hypothetical protein
MNFLESIVLSSLRGEIMPGRKKLEKRGKMQCAEGVKAGILCIEGSEKLK